MIEHPPYIGPQLDGTSADGHAPTSARKFPGTTAMRTMLWLAAVTVLIPPSAGLAIEENRQCWDCLQRLAMDFPAKNPQEDPFFEDGLPPSSAVGAFVKCSLDDTENPCAATDHQRVYRCALQERWRVLCP